MKVKIKPSVFDPSPRGELHKHVFSRGPRSVYMHNVDRMRRTGPQGIQLGGTVSSCIDVNIIMNDTSSAADYARNIANSERGRVFIRTCMLAGISSFHPYRNACPLQCFYTVVSAK